MMMLTLIVIIMAWLVIALTVIESKHVATTSNVSHVFCALLTLLSTLVIDFSLRWNLPESLCLVFSSFDFKFIRLNCFAVAINKSSNWASSIDFNCSSISRFFSRSLSVYVNGIVFLTFADVCTIFTSTTPALDDAAENKSVDSRNRKSYRQTTITHPV